MTRTYAVRNRCETRAYLAKHVRIACTLTAYPNVNHADQLRDTRNTRETRETCRETYRETCETPRETCETCVGISAPDTPDTPRRPDSRASDVLGLGAQRCVHFYRTA